MAYGRQASCNGRESDLACAARPFETPGRSVAVHSRQAEADSHHGTQEAELRFVDAETSRKGSLEQPASWW